MTTSTIYTFEREFASGGHIVGERLAAKLGIPFYDSQIVDLAAKSAGVNRKLFEGYDEKPTNSFLYSLVMGTYTTMNPVSQTPSLNISDRLFAEEAEIIRAAADKGPCVIVGRCSSYILRDRPNVVRTFITADLKARVEHAINDLAMSPNRIEDELCKRDKKRSNYFNYYSGQKWENASSYDITISTSKVGYDGAVDMILAFGELLERQRANA